VNSPLDALNTALAGRYRISRILGEGGMATVYLARDLRHDRDVSITEGPPPARLAGDLLRRTAAIS
jgi:serine/threonine-protein kinase